MKEKKLYLEKLNTHILISIFVFLASFIILFGIGGGPVTNDELKYLNRAMFMEADSRLLNRFVHIYLLRFFVWLGGPEAGAAAFTAIVMSATLAFTYLIGAGLSRWKKPASGLIAVVIVVLQPSIFRYVGVSYADFTLMMFVALGSVIFLMGAPTEERPNYFSAFFLGFVMFLAFKTKETGIILGLLYFGIIFGCGVFTLRLAVIDSFMWLCGLLCGLFVLMTVDFFILGDVFHSIRGQNMVDVIAKQIGNHIRSRGNSFSYVFLSDLAVPVFLYLCALFCCAPKIDAIKFKVLGFLPIFLALFLAIASVPGRWNLAPRYFVPAIPAVAAFGGYYLSELAGKVQLVKLVQTKPKTWALGALAISVALLGVVGAGMHLRGLSSTVSTNGWDPYTFVLNVIYPTVLAALLAVIVFVRQSSCWYGRLIIMTSFIAALPMMVALPNNLFFSTRLYQNRIYPLEVFKEYLHPISETKILVSRQLIEKTGMLEGAPFLLSARFNFPITDERFETSENWPENEEFDYAFGLEEDISLWRNVQGYSEGRIVREPEGKVILICRVETCR